ncbi:hypothetical protein niasHT_017734 [Heterodera trifolii]|uniref:Uncharacterized protein n=1 Tax=Heterodera trifolii TaxID=157864 RepID=A0ABD2L704_9BILA
MAGEKQEQQQKKQNELRKNMTMLDRAVVAVENRDEAAENDRQQVSPAFYNEFNGRFENSDDRRTQAWIRQLLFEVKETNRKEEDNKGTTSDGTVIFLSIFCFGVSVGFIIRSMFK